MGKYMSCPITGIYGYIIYKHIQNNKPYNECKGDSSNQPGTILLTKEPFT